ncbi:MAG: hypothetical protein ACM3XO_28975 [Bacteroidota bacterium]|jgi:hypothetical protein
MRKSTIFISAVLTTFALVMLYGVVSAYQSMAKAPEATPLPTDTATPEPDPTLAPTATQAALTPEQAAQLAAQVVGNTNLLSAESSNVNGTNAYKITFTNNDVVYVGLDGQILSVQVAPVTVNVAAPVQATKNKNKGNNNSSSQSHDNHEAGHDD